MAPQPVLIADHDGSLLAECPACGTTVRLTKVKLSVTDVAVNDADAETMRAQIEERRRSIRSGRLRDVDPASVTETHVGTDADLSAYEHHYAEQHGG